jgi:hypothetical protein
MPIRWVCCFKVPVLVANLCKSILYVVDQEKHTKLRIWNLDEEGSCFLFLLQDAKIWPAFINLWFLFSNTVSCPDAVVSDGL